MSRCCESPPSSTLWLSSNVLPAPHACCKEFYEVAIFDLSKASETSSADGHSGLQSSKVIRDQKRERISGTFCQQL